MLGGVFLDSHKLSKGSVNEYILSLRVIKSYSSNFFEAVWVELGERKRCFLLKAADVMLCTCPSA